MQRHWLLLLIYPLIGVGFSFCEWMYPLPVNVMEWQPWDGWIPFVPAMVWPYVAWYGVIVFALAWTGFREPAEFRRLVAFLYLGMTTAYLVYLVYPNGQNLRPDLALWGNGWDINVLRWLYTHDTPTNSNPSIHVIDTLAVWFALRRDRTLRPLAWFQAAQTALALAIVASTVLVKQHSVVDIFGGLACSALWYAVIYSRWSPWYRSPANSSTQG